MLRTLFLSMILAGVAGASGRDDESSTPSAQAGTASEQNQSQTPPADTSNTSGDEETIETPLTYAETVVVTAADEEQPLLDAVTLVSAFTEEDIVRTPAIVVDEQLRRVPGFSLFRRSSSLGSHPTTTGVSLRGIGPSGASRSLVLWGGVPLNDPFGNWVYWNRFPSTSLQRVEVSRGATSQLYGSSALGGTMQLLTRRPAPGKLAFRGQIGNSDTYDVDVFASDRKQDWAWVASGRIFNYGGFYKTRAEERGDVDALAETQFQSFLGRLEYKDFHVGVNLYHDDRSNGTKIQQNSSQIYLFETGIEKQSWGWNFYAQNQIFKNAFSRILPGRDQEFQVADDTFDSDGFGSALTMRTGFGIQWGFDWRYVKMKDRDLSEDWHGKSQTFAGAFLQYTFNPDERMDILLGGRADLYQNAGTKGTFNPRAGMVFRANDAMTVRASAYRGFRAPSLNELYRPFRVGNVVTAANDELIEEFLWGAEGGVDLHPTRSLLVRLNGYWNSLRDPVANVTVEITDNAILRQRQNIGSATIKGFEAEARYRVAQDWSLRGAYLLASAIDDDTGLRLPQVPTNSGTIGMGYDGPFQFTADVRFAGAAYEDDLNSFEMPAYGVVDLSVRIPLADRFGLYIAVENLFNEEYVVGISPIDVLGTPRMARVGIEFDLN